MVDAEESKAFLTVDDLVLNDGPPDDIRIRLVCLEETSHVFFIEGTQGGHPAVFNIELIACFANNPRQLELGLPRQWPYRDDEGAVVRDDEMDGEVLFGELLRNEVKGRRQMFVRFPQVPVISGCAFGGCANFVDRKGRR